MESVNDMLVFLRKKANLTQEEASKKIGISRGSLANYECGLRRPSYEVMEAIADFYNVDLDTIFGRGSQLSAENEKAPTGYSKRITPELRELMEICGDDPAMLKELLDYAKFKKANR